MDYQSSKNKKKISSIPWAHRVRLPAHAICITLGTAKITSPHRVSVLNFYNFKHFSGHVVKGELGSGAAIPTMQPGHAPISRTPKILSSGKRNIPPPQYSSYHFHARISTYLATHWTSPCPAFRTHRLLTINTHFGMKLQVYTPATWKAC